VVVIAGRLDYSLTEIVENVKNSSYSQVFFFEAGWSDSKNFFKQLLGGASMAIVMTGLDQDMMQKNLSCKNIGEAQKNMFSFSIILVFANLLFLTLGVLLFTYANQVGIAIPEKKDLLYPTIALQHLSPTIGIVFILGLIAAAYSSADSALTSLTTSFCIDFLGFEKSDAPETKKKSTRLLVHITFSFILFWIILGFWLINDDSVISSLFTAAVYTYGPLLGLYAFGFFTERQIIDKYTPIVCIVAPILTYLINVNSDLLLFGYKFSFELLILNGLLTFIGLWAISDMAIVQEENG